MKWLGLVVALFLAVGAFAENGGGTIAGRVTSEGKPLAGATVTIDSDALQTTRHATSTARGTWWAGQLPPGTYRIAFAHAGTQTVTRNAELRAAETVRLDADLAPAEEGESVTVTTTTRSILERPEIVTSADAALVDDLPLSRELSTRIAIAPGVLRESIRGSDENLYIVDGVRQLRRNGDVEIEEALADTAVLSTPLAVEYGRFSGGTIIAVTRSGGNDFTASLRATLTSDRWNAIGDDRATRSRLEGTAGGRLVRDALWFFLAGENATASPRERSMSAKITGSVGTRDTVVGSVLRASRPDQNRSSVGFTHIVTDRLVLDANADTAVRREGGFEDRERHASLALHSFLPGRYGDHAIDAGVERFHDSNALFATDSWSDMNRWTVSAGLRHDDRIGTSPRAGVSYSFGGASGAHAVASFGRYRGELDSSREWLAGYGMRVLTNGYARLALVKRSYTSGVDYRAVEADARAQYLFLGFGGSATAGKNIRTATAWVTADPPALEQHITVTLLERYRGELATDLSLQYRFARWPVQPFVKIDALNVFDQQLEASEDPLGARRAVRFAAGARY